VAGAHRLADENHESERQDACDNNRDYFGAYRVDGFARALARGRLMGGNLPVNCVIDKIRRKISQTRDHTQLDARVDGVSPSIVSSLPIACNRRQIRVAPGGARSNLSNFARHERPIAMRLRAFAALQTLTQLRQKGVLESSTRTWRLLTPNLILSG